MKPENRVRRFIIALPIIAALTLSMFWTINHLPVLELPLGQFSHLELSDMTWVQAPIAISKSELMGCAKSIGDGGWSHSLFGINNEISRRFEKVGAAMSFPKPVMQRLESTIAQNLSAFAFRCEGPGSCFYQVGTRSGHWGDSIQAPNNDANRYLLLTIRNVNEEKSDQNRAYLTAEVLESTGVVQRECKTWALSDWNGFAFQLIILILGIAGTGVLWLGYQLANGLKVLRIRKQLVL